MVNPATWSGKRVLVTGHTGFKGGWLSIWLAALGAKVAGYALDPPTDPSFFVAAGVGDVLLDTRGDIRDAPATRKAIESFDPEVLFHLAAQPIVREGYQTPIETYATNVVGTASVLEACRHAPSLRAIVVVTTDKCYENREWVWAYRETDTLGGHDPYSNSKACAEFVCHAFRRSFFFNQSPQVGLATARAGNVIGGGDWASHRLVPDLVRSAMAGQEAIIRNPQATRPWQHVLEPLHGYLILAENLLQEPQTFSEAWNFGPHMDGERAVRSVVETFARLWPGKVKYRIEPSPQAHEATKLMLDSSSAIARLGWKPLLKLEDALRISAEWYNAFLSGDVPLKEISEAQIRYYSRLF